YDFNFKESLTYKITRDRLKTVNLFLSEFIPTQKIKLQKSVIGASKCENLEEARKCLHYEELNELLKKAQDYIKNEISR
ncbi:UNVERIFIED_CONTAM: NUDIX hydrolase, partial [Lactiplantibacillus plantarum]|nr:NUDIX hydrolase [Lactiplantibacillus plantarum]